MSFPRYEHYKDSGVEWLGDVPAHWEVLPCRAIVHERTAKNDDAICQDYLSLMANVGIIPYEEKGDVGNKKPEDLSKCKIVTRGDFVINSMNYGIGSYGLSNYDGVCSPVYIVMKPQDSVVESRFAFRIFENRAFQTYAQSFGNGILEHRCAINWDILKGIGVGVPPKGEQQSILSFLDRETAKIDALIAEQQRLVALLAEKRQAVISHAVTKGLNPDAPMKDSGIEWLGEVPAGWEIVALKRVASIRYGIGEPPPYQSEGTPLIRATNVHAGYLHPEGLVYVNPEDIPEKRIVWLYPGDIIVVRSGAYTGDSAIIPDGFGDCIAGFDMVLRCGEEVVPKFIQYALLSRYLKEGQIDLEKMRAAQPHLNAEELGSCSLVLPDPFEQAAIAAFLDTETAKLDTLTAEAQRAIALLQERRTALISAAVTGKIDVRGIAPSVETAIQ